MQQTNTTAKPNTSAQDYKELAELQKKDITMLMQWTHEEFCNYQYQFGLAYLQHRFPADFKARQILERSRIFWNWYKFVWVQYDYSLLSFKRSLQECNLHTLRQCYEHLHCPQAMAADTRPSDPVLEELKNNLQYD